MSLEKYLQYFEPYGLVDRIHHCGTTCATVEDAASTLGVAPARIAKTLSFRDGEDCMMIVMAGNMGIDNKKYRNTFGFKARMLSPDEVHDRIGQMIGGVCPFAIPEGIHVYTDESLKEHETLFVACGSTYDIVELSPDEIFECGHAASWVDVCKERG